MSDPVQDFNELRQRVLTGGQYTKEELRNAVIALRSKRVEQSSAATAKRATKASTAAAKTTMSDEELNDSLKSLGLEI
jgi:hypothetical protein